MVEGGPLAARSPYPEGPWRLASPGCRGVASRSGKNNNTATEMTKTRVITSIIHDVNGETIE